MAPIRTDEATAHQLTHLLRAAMGGRVVDSAAARELLHLVTTD